MNIRILLLTAVGISSLELGLLAKDHPAWDRQVARDQRLSHYTLEFKQYGIVRKNFRMERMERQLENLKYGGIPDPTPEEPYPLTMDSKGYADSSFRFQITINAADDRTHVHRRILPQDEHPPTFPGLPLELRMTNVKGHEEVLTDLDAPVFAASEDHGLIDYRRTVVEWCHGFGLTRYVKSDSPIVETILESGITECKGTLIVPFIGKGSFHAEIDSNDVVRLVVFMSDTYVGEPVIQTARASGKHAVGNDWVSETGNFIRELPLQIASKKEGFGPYEIDDGYSTHLLTMTNTLSKEKFLQDSTIAEVPVNTFLIDTTQGKVSLPVKAGTRPTSATQSRFWLFTLNLAAVVAFLTYMWRRRKTLTIITNSSQET